MSIRRRIGLVYLSGALPCFEDFGNLPTDLIRKDGQVDGKPASDVLDMIIIPDGSFIESQSITPAVSREIVKMAEKGKFLLGVCSGFQVLAKRSDPEQQSAVGVMEGLGLIDAKVQPLICTDRVDVQVVGKSFLSNVVGGKVSGFHCHTYGKVILQGSSRSVFVSHVHRVNYKSASQELVSGVANKEGNVVGVLVHALLDKNPLLLEGLMESLDVNQVELQEIRRVNADLVSKMKCEVGIDTNMYCPEVVVKREPVMVLVTALGSGSGKTFLVTGMAGALRKRGYNVGLIKLGGDVRDSVSALYLVKDSMKGFASVKIGESGWLPVHDAVGQACGVHDFVFVEGAMSAFTGLLNSKTVHPSSSLEVAVSLGAAVILVVSCDKEGVEGGLVSVLNYIRMLKLLGVNPVGVILNKMSTGYLTEEDNSVIVQAFENVGVKLVGVVPSIKFEKNGMVPEVEICYDKFGMQALDVVERYINLEELVKLARVPCQNNVDYVAFVEKFKKLLINYPDNFSKGSV